MELALTTSSAFSVEEGKWDKKLVTLHTRQVSFRDGGIEDGKNERAEGVLCKADSSGLRLARDYCFCHSLAA